ncbi:immunity 42 family protein [Pseudomonas lijiangensis]|uniref:immunity 42 family protein n=1 Tax=Pseudomonas lijiangensis TaxID=2995658 RepID=UPI0031BA94E9
MILGDPYAFAVQFDVVESWNIQGDSWRNGVFVLYVDGQKVFDHLDVVELRTTIGFYSGLPLESLGCGEVESDFTMLYREAESYFTGEGESLSEGLCSLTCTAMEDRGCYVYFQRCAESDRFVWSVNGGVDISEAIFPQGTLRSVLVQLSGVNISV